MSPLAMLFPSVRARNGAVLDIRGWLQRVGVTVYCNVFLGCRALVGQPMP